MKARAKIARVLPMGLNVYELIKSNKHTQPKKDRYDSIYDRYCRGSGSWADDIEPG